MATIVTRAVKGAPLTHNEVDANFNNLNSDKVESSALGTAAYTDSTAYAAASHTHTKSDITDFSDGDYATAAQGDLADTALQSGDNISSLTNDAGYITTPYADSDVDTHLNTSTATSGEFLSWNGSDYDWMSVPAGYTNNDVDTHLNTSTATADQMLSWNGTDYDWVDAGAGATGGGSDKIFWENDQTVTTNYTITAGKNAGTFGPITIASGVTVTVGSGDTWTVV